MTEAKRFLNFITRPKDKHVILDEFGYKNGRLIGDKLLEKGYAEIRDHKMYITPKGRIKLKELEETKVIPVEEPQIVPIETPKEDFSEQREEILFLVLGIAGLSGTVYSVKNAVVLKDALSFGAIGLISLALLIVSLIVLFSKKKSHKE